MSLNDIFEETQYIYLGSCLKKIRYSMRSMAQIEKHFDNFDNFEKEIKSGDIDSLIKFIEIGINEKINQDDIDIRLLTYLYETSLNCFNYCMCREQKETKDIKQSIASKEAFKYPWANYYYGAIVEFKLTEQQFWDMLPKQFFTLIAENNKSKQVEETDKEFTEEETSAYLQSIGL